MRGFTLIEMLVAVTVFSVAAAMAYGGLAALTRARAQLDAQNDRIGRLQLAVGLLERDIRGVSMRYIRDGSGAPRTPLEGMRERIELSRMGFANSLELPRAEIERVGYRLQEGRLQRLRYPVLDRTPGSTPQVDDVLDRVERVDFAYVADDGRELAQWPAIGANSEAAAMPRAVIVTLTLDDLGEIRRVLELPRGDDA